MIDAESGVLLVDGAIGDIQRIDEDAGAFVGFGMFGSHWVSKRNMVNLVFLAESIDILVEATDACGPIAKSASRGLAATSTEE